MAAKLAETFDTQVAKRAGEIARTADAIKKWDDAQEVSGMIALRQPALLSFFVAIVRVLLTVHF